MAARRYVMVIVGALGVVLVGAATAWACTASAYIQASVSSAVPGDEVGVTGKNFPNDGTIRLYWEAAETGRRQLALETSGPQFAEPVTVPADAAGGTYLLRAYGYADGESEPAGAASAAVAVASPASEAFLSAGDDELAAVWSGAEGQAAGQASLTDSASTSSEAPVFAVGAAVFGLGVVLLAATGLALVVRRRPVVAHRTR